MIEKIEGMLALLYKHYAGSNSQTNSKDACAGQSHNYMHIDVEDDLSELLESQFAKHLEEEESIETKSEAEIIAYEHSTNSLVEVDNLQESNAYRTEERRHKKVTNNQTWQANVSIGN
ncbi:hypothetical protein BUALT_Bualt09G0070200 [Buddleja alternifolia]|uniref:Uncharacterized protein n=1 Tax=Buddleja alternifolia TaxID=168488 RepID=A0AAV6X207_9LAMI|nr:hypothetical protein BUALT_Bualt09G0070200 [Buddleja alternifolia]